MGTMQLGNQIRLTGDDAKDYLQETGRNSLPKTVNEFNRAQQDTADAWRATECPEGELLAFLSESSKIK